MQSTDEDSNAIAFRHAHTPPSSPYLHATSQLVTLEALKDVLVKINQEVQKLPASTDGPEATVTDPQQNVSGPQRDRASKLEFKAVDEVWDAKDYKYKIVESSTPKDDVAELDEYVFLVRKRLDKKTTEPTVFIDVNSEHLREALKVVLKDVKGINLRENKLSVERNLLFHFLDELRACQSSTGDVKNDEPTSPHRAHLGLLVDFIEKTYSSTTQQVAALLKHREITYDLLWSLFKPNMIMYTTCVGTKKPRCVKYNFGEEKKLSSGMIYYSLQCSYLDFDGKTFGEVSTELAIFKFRGTRRIETLPTFPLQFHPDKCKLTASLIQCGRTFISLMGAHHRQCRGDAFFMQGDDRPFQISVDSRIMVDAAFFRKMNPNYSRPRIIEPAKQDSSNSIYILLGGEDNKTDKIINNGKEPTELEEHELIVCCPTVPGFSFGDKLWLEFAVADIMDIEWSSLPFNCLTIPDMDKEIIIALAESRTGQLPENTFDDFVTGKGQGLNVLLHGPPGVGKTLTAEGISEHLKKPLYSISAGELGTEAEKLEKQLSAIFQIANQWDAILLLDEADVFLERRSSQNLHRNGLVSVFLRKLEYCTGILFLTTNRVSEFDEAILSRIHLLLKYENLNKDARKSIWTSFLKKAQTQKGAAKIGPKHLESLVKAELNGRQIKNAVAAAHALATKQGAPLAYSHLQQAVKTSENFIREFYGVHVVNSLYR